MRQEFGNPSQIREMKFRYLIRMHTIDLLSHI